MNKDEYVIVSKTKLLQRIEELEKVEQQQVGNLNAYIARGEIRGLKQVLSNSLELIPEIEKAFNEGSHFKEKWFKEISLSNSDIVIKEPNIEKYIKQLKLDI